MKKYKSWLLIIGAAICLVIIICFLTFWKERSKLPQGDLVMPENLEPGVVTYVIDGDTVVVQLTNDESEDELRVRLIGIDAPESANEDEEKNTEEGIAATEYTRSILLNKDVFLEYDKELIDKYGRTLAYIWVDGNLFNSMILEAGHANLLNIPPNEKYKEYLASTAGKMLKS